MLLMNFFCVMSIRLPLSTSIIATTDGLSGKATSLRTSLKPGYLMLNLTRLPVFILKMLRLLVFLSAS